MSIPLLEDLDVSMMTLAKKVHQTPVVYTSYALQIAGRPFRFSLGERRIKVIKNKNQNQNGKESISIMVFFDDERGYKQIEKFEEIRLQACRFAFEHFRNELNMKMDSAEDAFKQEKLAPMYYRKKDEIRIPGDRNEIVFFSTFGPESLYPTKYQEYVVKDNGEFFIKNRNVEDLVGREFMAIVQCSSGRFTSHQSHRIASIANTVLITESAEPSIMEDPAFLALNKDRVQASVPSEESKEDEATEDGEESKDSEDSTGNGDSTGETKDHEDHEDTEDQVEDGEYEIDLGFFKSQESPKPAE